MTKDANSRLGESQDAYQQVEQSDNQAEFSHELVGGAAAFGAMKIFEDRQRKEGTYCSLHVSISQPIPYSPSL
jgi:hypothetical protein